MGIRQVISTCHFNRSEGVRVHLKGNPVDDRVVTLKDALEMFSQLTFDGGANFGLRLEHLDEDGIGVWHEYYLGPIPASHGEVDGLCYSWYYLFTKDPAEELNYFERLEAVVWAMAYTWRHTRPELCSQQVLDFVDAMSAKV